MLDMMDTAKDVVALRIAGRITGADLDTVMNCLEEAMRGNDKVHLFVETSAIDTIEIAALPSYIARAAPLFGKLDRFGRVAVVADQAWIRIATRIESAILPFISYRVFAPEQRDVALAWVAGSE